MPAPHPARPTTSPTAVVAGLALLTAAVWGTLCAGIESLAWLITRPAAFGLAATLATATTLPYTLALLWVDRHEREPLRMLVAAFAWGALVATTFAGIGNGVVQSLVEAWTGEAVLANLTTASLAAPLFEETAKGVALLGLVGLVRREVDGPVDGMLYGALVGLGFAWFENISYYMEQAPEGPGAMVALAWMRGVLSGIGTHATFTGLTGLGVGVHRVTTGWTRWLVLPTTFALAMLAHFSWNTFSMLFVGPSMSDGARLFVAMPLAVSVLQAPFTVLLMVAMFAAWRHEDQVLRVWLADEGADILARGDLDHLLPARRRIARECTFLRHGGISALRRHRRLTQTLIHLAFARWHAERDGDDGQVDTLRARIRALRSDGTTL